MIKTIVLWGTAFLLLLQTIQIEIPKPPSVNPKHEITAPQNIMKLLKNSCYDCHSYQTKMPWYGNVAPFSWSVRNHINKGRNWLNFQEWRTYSEEEKQRRYEGIISTISYSMPMPAYLKFHEEAKLTYEQRKEIKTWAQSCIK